MKRFFALITTLVVGVPLIGFLCACCPLGMEGPSSHPVLAAKECDCCPEAVSFRETREATQDLSGFLQFFSSSRAFQLGFLILGSFLQTPQGPESGVSFLEKGPPVSDLFPTYLKLQVLRL